MQEKSIEQLTAEIKARYGIGGGGQGPQRFPILLICPSHYDLDGYVVQWVRPAASADSLETMHGRVEDSLGRGVLGADVETELRSVDERTTRVLPDKLAKELQGGHGLVILTGVQANQFSRAMDIALPLRVAGIPVCMEGLFVAGSMAQQGAATPVLREAMNLGISLLAGSPSQAQVDKLVRDAWQGRLQPLYQNEESQAASGATPPIAATRLTSGMARAMRLLPFECTFSTVVDVSGGSAEAAEGKIRAKLQHGSGRFLLADRNFSRNPEWEKIFDRLIAMREQEKLDLECVLQVDGVCHRLPRFLEKAARAGVRGVHVDLESGIGASSAESHRAPDSISGYRTMLLEWKRVGVVIFARYAVGGRGETAEEVVREVRMLKRELPVDVLEPGSAPPWEAGEKPGAAAWREFYTLEHMEKVLRRALATGTDVEELMAVLLWFHFCVVYERVDPLLGGSRRRKHRRDRRPSIEREDPLSFYPNYGLERAYKRIGMARLYRRFRRFVRQLEGEPGARSYTDPALAGTGGLLMPQVPAAR
ncbi:MAG: hypothetical protein WBD46_20460 [Acidobacteriaceae bacterium]